MLCVGLEINGADLNTPEPPWSVRSDIYRRDPTSTRALIYSVQRPSDGRPVIFPTTELSWGAPLPTAAISPVLHRIQPPRWLSSIKYVWKTKLMARSTWRRCLTGNRRGKKVGPRRGRYSVAVKCVNVGFLGRPVLVEVSSTPTQFGDHPRPALQTSDDGATHDDGGGRWRTKLHTASAIGVGLGSVWEGR
jgi:hypothetical protein